MRQRRSKHPLCASREHHCSTLCAATVAAAAHRLTLVDTACLKKNRTCKPAAHLAVAGEAIQNKDKTCEHRSRATAQIKRRLPAP